MAVFTGLGSNTAPSFTFSSDTNTGIYSPGADQVAISTGGTQRINIEADGNINIDSGGVFYNATYKQLAVGTTSPDDSLQINKNATNAANAGLTFKSANSNESLLSVGISTSLGTACIASSQNGTGSVLPIAFIVGLSSTDERMRIASDGKVGLGTSTPASLLSLYAGTNSEYFRGGGNGTTARDLVLSATTGINAGDTHTINASGSTGRLIFSTASSPRLTINSSGIVNVGNTPVYADNAAAKAGGLVDGDIYRKSDGTLMIVYT